jgi:hypothetical protein
MIREGRWPPGYPPILLVQGVFEGGTRQADIVRMSGLAVVSFTGLDHNGLSELRQSARDDPHTLLMFGDDDVGLTVIYAYERNRRFEVVSLEFQLVRRYFRKPSAEKAGEFIDVATAMQIMSGNIAQKLNKESVDLAFAKLGFESILSEEGDSGYLAVRRTVEEMQSLGVQMAYNARRAVSDEPF